MCGAHQRWSPAAGARTAPPPVSAKRLVVSWLVVAMELLESPGPQARLAAKARRVRAVVDTAAGLELKPGGPLDRLQAASFRILRLPDDLASCSEVLRSFQDSEDTVGAGPGQGALAVDNEGLVPLSDR